MGDFEQGWRQGARGPRLLGHGVPLVGVAAVAAFNGSLLSLVIESVAYSPIFDPVSYYVSAFARDSYFDGFVRGVLLSGPQFYQSLTSAFISLMTMLIAGIPPAIYERIRGHKTSTPISLGIWLAAAVLLSLPTIMRAIEGDEF